MPRKLCKLEEFGDVSQSAEAEARSGPAGGRGGAGERGDSEPEVEAVAVEEVAEEVGEVRKRPACEPSGLPAVVGSDSGAGKLHSFIDRILRWLLIGSPVLRT